MKEKSTLLKMIPVFLSSFIAWFYCMIFTPLGYLYNDFPGQDNLIMLVAVLPGIIAMVGGFSSSALTQFMDKKSVVIISIGMMILGAAMVRFFGATNLEVVIIGSGLTGFAAGSIPASNLAILAEISPEKLKDKVVGWSDAMCMVGVLVATLVGGLLASSGQWYRAFDVYYLALPILLLVIIWYPSNKTAAAFAMNNGLPLVGNTKETSSEVIKSYMPKSVYGVIVVKMISAFFYMTVSLFLSAYVINELQLGSSVIVGTANSIGAFVNILGSLFVFIWLKTFKTFSTVAAMVIMGISMIFMVAFPTTIGILIFNLVLAFGMNTNHSSNATVVTMAPKGKAISLTTGLFVGATFVGEALCGYVVPWISTIVFGSAEPSHNLIVGGIGCIVMGFISMIFFKKVYLITFPKKQDNNTAKMSQTV